MRNWLINIRGNKTQQIVAKQCGISQNFYSWIERGERSPSVEVAKKIASALGFNWVMFFDDNHASPDSDVYCNTSQSASV